MAQRDVCHVVLLTPIGRGAVTTVLVDGKGATDLVSQQFRSSSGIPLRQVPIDRIVVGRWLAGGNCPGEELVVCRRAEDRVEVHCHGGTAAVRAILETLITAGCLQIDWQAWTCRSETDPLAANARIALAHARTERAAGVLLDQYRGALRRAIEQIVVELEAGATTTAHDLLENLVRYVNIGAHLTVPWRVVLTGRPNVGKSSLINALIGYRRAIVFPTPGTTRDVVTATSAIDGWPVQWSDTAGLRAGGDDVERAGVERAWQQTRSADQIVAVFDASEPWTDEDTALAASLPDALVVHNKCDLVERVDSRRPVGLEASAITGEGISHLIDEMARRLVPNAPPPGTAVPFTAEQIEAIQRALAAVESGDIHSALSALRQILSAPKPDYSRRPEQDRASRCRNSATGL